MRIIISPRAKKQLSKLSKLDQIIIAKKIRSLSNREKSTQIKQLSGYKNIFRIRVGGFRLVYQQNRGGLYIILIGNRKNIYQVLHRLMR